jgi:thiol-disulfide isomerase/thioredoxin
MKEDLRNKEMKKGLIILVGMLVFLLIGDLNRAANLPPAKGGVLPPIRLLIPKDPIEKRYLGLSGEGSFRLPQIKAKVVIIEIFSLYCPVCVKLAPRMKELYQVIENSPDLKAKIKLIGIGAGNNPNEVQTFKNIGDTPFPLFPDEDFAIHDAIGEVRTPYFIGIKIHEDGTHKILYSESGGFEDANIFLELVLANSGIR